MDARRAPCPHRGTGKASNDADAAFSHNPSGRFLCGRIAAGQALDEAEARAGSAQEKVENLKAPHRQPEIAALEAILPVSLMHPPAQRVTQGSRMAAGRTSQESCASSFAS
ncbi:MAG: hypothetical protein WAZ34_05785 [Rhodocyclaceae bacterium]